MRLTALSLVIASWATLSLAEDRTWFRGNTHTHSLWSDGNDFPEMITDWYHENGYDFLAISDHNILSRGEKWMTTAAIKKRQKALGTTALQKLEARYGAEWIERRTNAKGEEEVRLRALDEFRERYEKDGKFLLIEAEEISNSFKKAPVHINAIGLQELIPAQTGESIVEIIQKNVQQARAQEEKTGKPNFLHLNHPNFRWAITAEQLAEAVEMRYFEVYNGHPGINHLGDADHPSDERIWDIANHLRIQKFKAAPLMGIATDDSHTYHGGGVSPGRGWIMVHATSLKEEALINAVREGHFYASSGVSLDDITFDKAKGELRFKILPVEGETYTTEMIGSTADEVGAVFAKIEGNEVSYTIKPGQLYVRATVTSSAAAPNPSFKGMMKQAWTQPVGWEK